MTVHELRQFFMGLSRDRSRSRLVITLLSFGFKHGVPVDADLVFDVRCLPNPHFVPTLRRRTGRDKAVADFLERDPSTREFMDRLEDYLRYVVPFYIAEGKSYLTIAIGCTGGRHRSVMIAERLRKRAGRPRAWRGSRVRHRDLAKAVGVDSHCDWRRGRHARAARHRAGQRRGDDRRRPAAVHRRLDRLARRCQRRARGDRAGHRARARRGRASCS